MFIGSDGVPPHGIGIGRTQVAWDTKAQTELPNGRWVHVAVVRESGTLNIYYDGQRQHNVPNSQKYVFTDGKIILGFESAYFNGYMEEVLLSKYARYSGESFAVPSSPTDIRVKGEIVEYVVSDNRNAYPENGIADDGYFYERIEPVEELKQKDASIQLMEKTLNVLGVQTRWEE